MSYLNHNLPTITCYIRNEFLYNHKKGHGEVTLCDVHSVASLEKHVPLFEAFLENGVNWTRRPIHAFCWKPDAQVPKLEECMWWDCFSPYVDVQVRSRLANLRAELINYKGKKNEGTYLFTLDWSWESKSTLNTNFSETPEHKCAHFFKMDNGNFYAYPNNKILWYDDAWIRNRITKNPGYEIDLTEYSVENLRKIETSDDFMYEVTEIRDSNPVKSSDLTNQEQKMGQPSDRDKDYMKEVWGTTKLITDYMVTPPKMLREIANDDLTPKKHDFVTQNDLHEKIRNDDDYDDWEYGAEPLYESKNYNK